MRVFRKKTKFSRCWNCGKKIPKSRIKCDKCANEPIEFTNKKTAITLVPGYNSPGYNEGLGKIIRNKKQYNEECKKNGFIPVG
jgi:predicted ATP-dependent serine protease